MIPLFKSMILTLKYGLLEDCITFWQYEPYDNALNPTIHFDIHFTDFSVESITYKWGLQNVLYFKTYKNFKSYLENEKNGPQFTFSHD